MFKPGDRVMITSLVIAEHQGLKCMQPYTVMHSYPKQNQITLEESNFTISNAPKEKQIFRVYPSQIFIRYQSSNDIMKELLWT